MANNSITHSLLSQLSEQDRHSIVKNAVQSLKPGTSIVDLQLAVRLFVDYPAHDIELDLCTHLYRALANGETEAVKTACSHSGIVWKRLQNHVANTLYQAAHDAVLSEADIFTVRPITGLFDQSITFDRDQSSSQVDLTANYLKYALSTVGVAESDRRSEDLLFRASLAFLGATDDSISTSAKRVITAIALRSTTPESLKTSAIWQTIQNLISDETPKTYSNTGYSLWLQLMAINDSFASSWSSQQYWALIRRGLQNGDDEQRKQCLGIARQSILSTVSREPTRSLICPRNDADATPRSITAQYERYFTVYETIVLGRYSNQIVACLPDLGGLSWKDSLVSPEWIYILLDTAMKGNSRKIVGDWLMRENFLPAISSEFVQFMADVFLPWGTAGSLFANSLQKVEGVQTCVHGERLAEYLSHLIRLSASEPQVRQQLVEVMLNQLNARVSNSFAYAAVYVLEGIGRAFDKDESLTFPKQQLDQLDKLSYWVNLPEVARDYVLIRCWQLCADGTLRLAGSEPDTNDRVSRWNRLQQTIVQQRVSFESVISHLPELSLHDSQENVALRNGLELKSQLESDAVLSSGDLVTRLSDFWDDIEYLEFPKQHLIILPSIILHPRILTLASDSESLAQLIVRRTNDLQVLTKYRLYLFAPLVFAVNAAVFSNPKSTDIIPLQDFILFFNSSLPIATIDLRLEDATASLLHTGISVCAKYDYEHYFGYRASTAIASVLDLVSRIGADHPDIIDGVFETILARWLRQKVPAPSVSPWKSALSLQLLLIGNEHILLRSTETTANRMLENLLHLLSSEPLPHYRYLLAWIIARIYERFPTLQASILDAVLTKDHHSNPKFLTALMKVAAIVARASTSQEAFAAQLAVACIPMAASSKVVIRYEAQWQIPILMAHARDQNWPSLTTNASLMSIDTYIRGLDNFGAPPAERQIDIFSLSTDHTLANLVEGAWFDLGDVERSTCSRADFLLLEQIYTGHALHNLPERNIPLGDPLTTTARANFATLPNSKNALTIPETPLHPPKAEESRALQTKGTAYLSHSLANLDLDDNDGNNTSKRARARDIIVVASLVENPYNLGGLSRVSEIFGAREMHLQNQNVTSNKEFLNVAVSSYLHLPILQLSAPGVASFCAEKREQGWTIVGMEQTDRSVLLGSAEAKLPRKMVLVMGAERDGIPALVLGECDLLVEIPQQGITRSLNVQTATGIVLFEYARQHG